MKKLTFILFFTWFASMMAFGQGNLTAPQILSKTVNLISTGKGIDAEFTVINSGYSGKGTLKSSGEKFTIKMPDVEIWYNGKDMYTYNKRSGETTVITPTQEELAESNPLAYVTGAQKNYNVVFSTVKKAGKYVLELTPKTKGGDIKRVTLTVKPANFTPEKLVVEPTSGSPITIEITTLKTGVACSYSDFEYPKSKYPKIEIIDLR